MLTWLALRELPESSLLCSSWWTYGRQSLVSIVGDPGLCLAKGRVRGGQRRPLEHPLREGVGGALRRRLRPDPRIGPSESPGELRVLRKRPGNDGEGRGVGGAVRRRRRTHAAEGGV